MRLCTIGHLGTQFRCGLNTGFPKPTAPRLKPTPTAFVESTGLVNHESLCPCCTTWTSYKLAMCVQVCNISLKRRLPQSSRVRGTMWGDVSKASDLDHETTTTVAHISWQVLALGCTTSLSAFLHAENVAWCVVQQLVCGGKVVGRRRGSGPKVTASAPGNTRRQTAHSPPQESQCRHRRRGCL